MSRCSNVDKVLTVRYSQLYPCVDSDYSYMKMSTCLCKVVVPTKGLCGVNVRSVWGGCIEDIED